MKTKLHIFLLLACLFGGGAIASAQQTTCTPGQKDGLTEYCLLAPIPVGEGGAQAEKTTAETFIPGLFRLGIMLATGLAVLYIIWGGVQYMSTDAWGGKNDAKDTIWNAVMGLLLALSAWLIIATINPNLMNFNLSIERFEIKEDVNLPTGSEAADGYALTPDEVVADNAIEKRLGDNTPPVKVNADPCVTGRTTGCTNLVGLSENAINGVMTLASSCYVTTGRDCNVRISGGTEGGHVTHGQGLPVVDLNKNSTLNNYITRNGQSFVGGGCGLRNAPKYNLGGAIYVDEGHHWHVCY
jgi:hypothetical protein